MCSDDSYFVGVYWSARPEDSRVCADRISGLLRDLADIDVRLSRWFMAGRSRKDALRGEIPADGSIIQELLERGRNRKNIDGPLRDSLGYSLSLWNGTSSDEQAISILFRCGVFANNVGNSVVLSLPANHQAGKEAFDFEMVRRQIIALVHHFAPDWGVANSHAVAHASSSVRPDTPRAGWLTYLRNHSEYIPLAHSFEIEPIDITGILLIATKETFCAANEGHMASVAAVADWLAQVFS